MVKLEALLLGPHFVSSEISHKLLMYDTISHTFPQKKYIIRSKNYWLMFIREMKNTIPWEKTKTIFHITYLHVFLCFGLGTTINWNNATLRLIFVIIPLFVIRHSVFTEICTKFIITSFRILFLKIYDFIS